MFLVQDKRAGLTTNIVVTVEDPRDDGFQGEVVEGVTCDYGVTLDGKKRKKGGEWPFVGRSLENPKFYKEFANESELESSGYSLVAGGLLLPFRSWKQYLQLLHPEDLADADWFDELDRLDEAARIRRQRDHESDLPPGKNKDDIAAWVAKQHFLADSSVREIWYLPGLAPPDQIRLLEVSDRAALPDTKPVPMDFGLDVEGVSFKLLVADVTSEQLDRIKRDASQLPAGWSLDDNKTWRRGA